MANPEHVKIVKQGEDAIAAWRKKHPKERLDLSGADLFEADLSGADLSGAQLTSANLNFARLNSAVLVHANLNQADLICADLSGADLTSARLGSADLSLATLTRATLNGADLTNAMLGATTFCDTNLANVRGLDHLQHILPSTIGVDTLFKSKGEFPEAFLRGCGVPEILIEHLPGLIEGMEPIQFYSCFISYCSADDRFARRLHGRLRDEKLRVWFAPEDIKSGEKVAPQIDEAIRAYDRLLLVLSQESMASEWVRREIKRARQKERRENRNVLFPIALAPYDEVRAWECLDSDTGEDLAEKVREYHIPDFSRWKQEDEFEKAFARLMDDLRAEKPRRGIQNDE